MCARLTVYDHYRPRFWKSRIQRTSGARKFLDAYIHATSRNKTCIIQEDVWTASAESSPVSCTQMGDRPAINDPGSSNSKYILVSPPRFSGFPTVRSRRCHISSCKWSFARRTIARTQYGIVGGMCMQNAVRPDEGKYWSSLIASLLRRP